MRKLNDPLPYRMAGKEVNQLRISDLDYYFNEYRCHSDYYESPFSVLNELEKEIKYLNDPPEVTMISYKPGGDIIFRLERIYQIGDIRIVEYSYDTSIS